jgi:hypothetical protein
MSDRLSVLESGLSATFRARYSLKRLLGEGASGVVVHAEDRQLSREVAIKLVPCPGVSPEHERFKRLMREAEVQSRVQHPSVVRLFDVGVDSEIVYLVFELVSGTTLSEQLRGEKWAATRVKALMLEVLGGLEALHAAGVVHRDVKPSNLMATDAGIRMIDLGIASVKDAVECLTRTGEMLGTPAYVAPEQARGEDAAAQADLYALGVIAFQALTGRLPFEGSAAEVIAGKVVRDAPAVSSLAPVPEPLGSTVDRLLAREPSARPATAAEVRTLLERPAGPPRRTARSAALTPSEAAVATAQASATQNSVALPAANLTAFVPPLLIGISAGLFLALATRGAPPPAFSAPVLRPGLTSPTILFRRDPPGPARLLVAHAGQMERAIDAPEKASEHAVPVSGLPPGTTAVVRAAWGEAQGPSLTFTAPSAAVRDLALAVRARGVYVAFSTALEARCRLGTRASPSDAVVWHDGDSGGTAHRFAVPLADGLVMPQFRVSVSAAGETVEQDVAAADRARAAWLDLAAERFAHDVEKAIKAAFDVGPLPKNDVGLIAMPEIAAKSKDKLRALTEKLPPAWLFHELSGPQGAMDHPLVSPKARDAFHDAIGSLELADAARVMHRLDAAGRLADPKLYGAHAGSTAAPALAQAREIAIALAGAKAGQALVIRTKRTQMLPGETVKKSTGAFALAGRPQAAELRARLRIAAGRQLKVSLNGRPVRFTRPDGAKDATLDVYARVDPSFLREGENQVVVTCPPMPPVMEAQEMSDGVTIEDARLVLRVSP